MALCIVCNQNSTPEGKSIDEGSYGETLRVRLEKVLGEFVPMTGFMCVSCQFDLDQIETYYSLLETFKQRYKNTAELWTPPVKIKVENSAISSNILHESTFQPDMLLTLGAPTTPVIAEHMTSSHFDQVHANIENHGCLNMVNKSEVIDSDMDNSKNYISHNESTDGNDTESYDEAELISAGDGQNEETNSMSDSTKTQSEPFKCSICMKAFNREVGLKIHKRVHEMKIKANNFNVRKKYKKRIRKSLQLKCSHCDETFSQRIAMERHIAKEHTGTWRFRCTLCKKGFLAQYELNRHTEMHVQKRSHVCEQCGKDFKSVRHLKMHMHFHTQKSLHTCVVCKRDFLWKSALEIHQKVHVPLVYLKCSFCDKFFTKRPHLVFHERSHLPSNKNKADHPCYKCGKLYPRHRLKFHIMAHNRINKHPCPFCTRMLPSKSALQSHKEIHGKARPYKCDVCDGAYKTKDYLNQHKKLHTTETFQCPECDKSYTQKKRLKEHLLTHEGKREFSCPICYKTFTYRDGMRTHMKVHSDERPYVCMICKATFRQLKSLKQHIARHANNPGQPLRLRAIKRSNAYERLRTQNGDKTQCPPEEHKPDEKDKTRECKICNKSFKNRLALAGHMSAHKEKPSKIVDVKPLINHDNA